MLRQAMEAADYALTRFEGKLDDAIGRRVRLAIGRYASVVVLGIPIAWFVSGFHWDRTSTLGLLAGIVLYAIVDVTRVLTKPKAKSP